MNTPRRTSALLLGLLAPALLGAAPLPDGLTGIWGSPTATRLGGNDLVAHGSALYLTAEGKAALAAAPPPVGMAGSAVYDADRQELVITLTNGTAGTERQNVRIVCRYREQPARLAGCLQNGSESAQNPAGEDAVRLKDSIHPTARRAFHLNP